MLAVLSPSTTSDFRHLLWWGREHNICWCHSRNGRKHANFSWV